MNLPLAPPDIHAIRALHDKWIDPELRGDIAAVLELCTDDVCWLVPNGAPVEGKAALCVLRVFVLLRAGDRTRTGDVQLGEATTARQPATAFIDFQRLT